MAVSRSQYTRELEMEAARLLGVSGKSAPRLSASRGAG